MELCRDAGHALCHYACAPEPDPEAWWCSGHLEDVTSIQHQRVTKIIVTIGLDLYHEDLISCEVLLDIPTW